MSEKELNETLKALLEQYCKDNLIAIQSIDVNWIQNIDGSGRIIDIQKTTDSFV